MKCPYCHKFLKKKRIAVDHVNKCHAAKLEKDQMDACQALYYYQHGKLTGTCMVCGKETAWNYKTGKPARMCGSEECRKQLRTLYSSNMKNVYGTDNLLADMEVQRELQHHRKIAGVYTFKTDGGKVEYMGQLERNFLVFCDTILDLPSSMIFDPPEYFPYYDEQAQKWRTYMPDYYLPDYNLLVEIKDGGNHPNGNMEFNKTTKYKVQYKDKAMQNQDKYNYIRISGANYGPFLEVLYQIVHEQEPDNKKRKAIVIINEEACVDYSDHVDYDIYREQIHRESITLRVGYILNTSTVGYIAITDSRYNTYFMVTDYQDQTLKTHQTVELPELYADCTPVDYSFVGDLDSMQKAFITILHASTSTTYVHGNWDIMHILTDYDIAFDDGMVTRNNEMRKMDFVKKVGAVSNV